MKLTVIGGGSFRTPYIMHELLADRQPWVDELCLLDPSAERLAAMRAVLEAQSQGRRAPRVTTTTRPEEAFPGSDIIFTAVRVGGLEGRRTDELVAADLGVLGQETTGPGGIAFSLRTIPVMLRYAEQVAALAPDAWVLNFTNPAGIITEAMQSVLGDRVVGVCDTPSGLVRRVSAAVGVDPATAVPDYVGLNHLGWLNGLRSGGRDVLADLLADDERLATLEEASIFGPRWLRILGAVPNEYLYYYYENREAVRDAPRRGDDLRRSQHALFDALSHTPEQALHLWHSAVLERNSTYMAQARGDHAEAATTWSDDLFVDGYAAVAVSVVRAILLDDPTVAILNVRNGTTVPGLPADAVVEVPCRVDRNGPRPLPVSAPSLHQSGLMQQVKHVERLAISAATHGDPEAALGAFGLHPLVDSFTVAETLLHTYVASQPELAAVLEGCRC